MAALFTVLFAILAWPTFRLLGGRGAGLAASVAYGRVLFGGAIAIWLANMWASILRGTGNMLVPGAVMTVSLTLSIPLAGALTLGWFELPALGVRGPAVAFVTTYAVAGTVMGGYVLAGRAGLRLHWSGLRLRADLAGDILRVGLFGCANSTLTIVTVIVVTAMVGRHGTAALAGYGLGSRLEILLVPIAFGVGAALVALVGANRGAGQFARARRIAWTAGLAVFALCAVIGTGAVLAPDLWIGLFSRDAEAADVARQYLRIAGWGYPIFGLGMVLYFASQGTGNMNLQLVAGSVRAVIVIGLGSLLVHAAGAPLNWLFGCVAAGLVAFGAAIAWAVKYGRVWNPDRTRVVRPGPGSRGRTNPPGRPPAVSRSARR